MIYYAKCSRCNRVIEYSSREESKNITPLCCGKPTTQIDKPKKNEA